MSKSNRDKNLFWGFTILVTVALGTSQLFAQYTKDPQWLLYQTHGKQQIEQSGFASAHIDNLHLKISKTLPNVNSLISTKDGESKISFQVSQGQGIEYPYDSYLYSSQVILFTDAQASNLEKVQLRFARTYTVEDNFRIEIRVLENPSPNFYENFQQLDKNDDMVLSYYESENGQCPRNMRNLHPESPEDEMIGTTYQFEEFSQEKFCLIKQVKLTDLPDFDKKILLINSYIEYLSKAQFALERKEQNLKFGEAFFFRKIMQLD